jgi:hypothetical protein
LIDALTKGDLAMSLLPARAHLALVALLLAPGPAAALPVHPTGGAFFWCAAFQMLKVVSLATGRLEGAVVGAIGGGLACGMGW